MKNSSVSFFHIPVSSGFYLPSLYRQEYNYNPIDVTVETSDGKQYTCRSYTMKDTVIETLTSPQYKSVIINGAKETGLPKEYLDFLNSVKDNGYDGHVEILTQINGPKV